jgi:Mce-associated membrane protein
VTGRHRRGRRRRSPLVLFLMVACLAAATAAGVLGWQRHQRALEGAARTDAVRSARVAAGDILGYDYRSVEQSIRRARSETTGKFRRDYDSTASVLLPQSKQLKAIVQATVGSAAVMSATRDRVVVLLFVDQATVKQQPGAKTPETRIDQSRVRMTMTKTGGHWLVSELAAL